MPWCIAGWPCFLSWHVNVRSPPARVLQTESLPERPVATTQDRAKRTLASCVPAEPCRVCGWRGLSVQEEKSRPSGQAMAVPAATGWGQRYPRPGPPSPGPGSAVWPPPLSGADGWDSAFDHESAEQALWAACRHPALVSPHKPRLCSAAPASRTFLLGPQGVGAACCAGTMESLPPAQTGPCAWGAHCLEGGCGAPPAGPMPGLQVRCVSPGTQRFPPAH